MKYILCLKSYGDLVILLNATRGSDIKLLIGDHLKELFLSINSEEKNVIFLKTGFKKVPPFYDLKKSTFCEIFLSFLFIQLSLIKFRFFDIYVINKKTRDYFFVGLRLLEIPNTHNIYNSYSSFLNLPPVQPLNRKKFDTLFIFPSSRVFNKCIPVSTLKSIVYILFTHKINYKVILIEGDTHNHLFKSLKYDIMTSSFTSTIPFIKSCSAIISSDSLVSHLSEYYSIPTFVFSPINNLFWYPPSVIISNNYDNFTSSRRFISFIENIS